MRMQQCEDYMHLWVWLKLLHILAIFIMRIYDVLFNDSFGSELPSIILHTSMRKPSIGIPGKWVFCMLAGRFGTYPPVIEPKKLKITS